MWKRVVEAIAVLAGVATVATFAYMVGVDNGRDSRAEMPEAPAGEGSSSAAPDPLTLPLPASGQRLELPVGEDWNLDEWDRGSAGSVDVQVGSYSTGVFVDALEGEIAPLLTTPTAEICRAATNYEPERLEIDMRDAMCLETNSGAVAGIVVVGLPENDNSPQQAIVTLDVLFVEPREQPTATPGATP